MIRVALCTLLLGGCDLVFELRDPPLPSRPVKPPGCSPATMLVDEFNGVDELPRPWGVIPGAATQIVREIGAEMVIDVQGGSVEVFAEPFLDLREQQYSVHVGQRMGNESDGDQMSLHMLTQDGTHRLVFGAIAKVTTGVVYDLVAGYFDETGEFFTVGSIPYDENAHQRLAVAHSGTVTTFRAGGPDGVLKDIFINVSPPLDWITFMRPSLFVSGAAPMQFVFDHFGEAQATGEACPADVIQETFSDGLSEDWQRLAENGTLDFDTAGDMRCQVGSDPDEEGGCLIQTSTYYNLREHSVTIRIKEYVPGSVDDALAVFDVESRAGHGFFAITPDNKLSATFDIDGNPQTPIAKDFDVGVNGFLRISGTADDVLLLDVSADGVTFEPFAATTIPGGIGPLDAVRLAISFVATGGGSPASLLRVGGINGP